MPSWEAVRQSAAPQALRLYRPADDPILPWPGIIAGVLVIGVYFWCSSQFIIQRSLAAKNLDHGRWGSLLATVWAPHIARFPTLWQYLQSILSYITPPVVALLLLGIFWRRANGFGATTTMAVGVPL